MKHSFQKETAEKFRREREWNEKQISSPTEKNKTKQNKRGSKCHKKQLSMLLWSDVYYQTNLDNTRQPSDIYQ